MPPKKIQFQIAGDMFMLYGIFQCLSGLDLGRFGRYDQHPSLGDQNVRLYNFILIL